MMRPPSLMQRGSRAHGGSHAADIDGELPVERGRLLAPVGYRAGDEHAGVVDEDVEPAEAIDHRFDQAVHLVGVGLVGLEGWARDALALQFVDHGLGLVGRGR